MITTYLLEFTSYMPNLRLLMPLILHSRLGEYVDQPFSTLYNVRPSFLDDPVLALLSKAGWLKGKN